jgi:hypothetical protein
MLKLRHLAVAAGTALALVASATCALADEPVTSPHAGRALAATMPRIHFSQPAGRHRHARRRREPIALAAAGHTYAHPSLRCYGNRIETTDDFYASTNGGADYVVVQSILARWNGTAWVVDASTSPVAAASLSAMLTSYSAWTFADGSRAPNGVYAGWNIGRTGYYGIVQRIQWYSRSTGQKVDEDTAWLADNALADSSLSTYCRF